MATSIRGGHFLLVAVGFPRGAVENNDLFAMPLSCRVAANPPNAAARRVLVMLLLIK
jgi:hypothetical protein